MQSKRALVVAHLIVLQCLGFSFQASAMTTDFEGCGAKLEAPLNLVRARIMPVGLVPPNVLMNTFLHQTADGRQLLASVSAVSLAVFEQRPDNPSEQPVFSQTLLSRAPVKPLWLKMDDGDSALIFVDARTLHVEFPASRRVPIVLAGLPWDVASLQVLRIGADNYVILVVSEMGGRTVLGLRQNELRTLNQLAGASGGALGTPALLIPGSADGEAYLLDVHMDVHVNVHEDALQISALAEPHARRILLALSPGERVFKMHAVKLSPLPIVEIQTQRRTLQLEISHSEPRSSDGDKSQGENSDKEK